jgi:hypothetical protein
VRHLLWSKGESELFPAEVRICRDESGRYIAPGFSGRDLRVGIACTAEVAVSIAAHGKEPAIAVTVIVSEAEQLESEQRFIDPERPDESLARLRCARQAAAQAKGVRLVENTRLFAVTQVEGERYLVDGCWVETRVHGSYVVAWTVL